MSVDVLRQVLAAFNAHDLDAIMARFGDDDHFVSGNRGVSEWTLTGTTVDGERIDVRGCDLWTFGDDGSIVRKDSFWKIREG